MRDAWKRLGSFTAVGTVAFIVDIAVFNILSSGLGMGPISSKVSSVALATGVSWWGSRHFTFRGFGGRAKRQEAILFGLTNLVGLGIATACLFVSHYVLGFRSPLADNISGNVIGVLLGNVFRYLAYRFVVFQSPHRASDGRSGVEAAAPGKSPE
ncbi:GtrA family protein [Arthrobacter antioxidans]|uniref:GtrA family protein n=1 Tax=Arthrobacter antioxidans TaxID=2895818 RepID=UPI001FFE45D2|nr:GtrA family protein [Arthrobacter antioxidans]